MKTQKESKQMMHLRRLSIHSQSFPSWSTILRLAVGVFLTQIGLCSGWTLLNSRVPVNVPTLLLANNQRSNPLLRDGSNKPSPRRRCLFLFASSSSSNSNKVEARSFQSAKKSKQKLDSPIMNLLSQRRQRRKSQHDVFERKSSFVAISAIFLASWTWYCRAAGAATQSTIPATASTAAVLSWRNNIVGAASMLIALAVIPIARRAPVLARFLFISASRCALQVYLLGSVVLYRLLQVQNPAITLAWIFGVGLVAGREAFSRIQWTYPKMRRHVYTSIWSGGALVLGLTMWGRVLGLTEPWFQPRTWIPVAGMLFGNTLSATALGASAITQNFVNRQDIMELMLARGATWREAASPILQETLSTALTPTINGLAVTGVVHIPGMMTGQILAGQSVSQAAIYQILISFLIATTACTTVQLLMRPALASLVDRKHHRLRQGVLVSSLVAASSSDTKKRRENLDTVPSSLRHVLANPLQKIADSPNRKDIVLEADGWVVPRAQTSVNFQLKPGYRIGITGTSGIGKSQILRSIGGLEESPSGTLFLDGTLLEQLELPAYRRDVSLVPQRSPVFEGTPRQLYNRMEGLDWQKRYKSGARRSTSLAESPIEIASPWGIEERLWDQSWNTLSGGEAERITLAMAVALQPKVLLLDESLSALDSSTAQKVEDTLIRSQIPILLVTHDSRDQLHRFCTHHLDLSSTALISDE